MAFGSTGMTSTSIFELELDPIGVLNGELGELDGDIATVGSSGAYLDLLDDAEKLAQSARLSGHEKLAEAADAIAESDYHDTFDATSAYDELSQATGVAQGANQGCGDRQAYANEKQMQLVQLYFREFMQEQRMLMAPYSSSGDGGDGTIF